MHSVQESAPAASAQAYCASSSPSPDGATPSKTVRTTRRTIRCGMDLLAFSPLNWRGPRPAKVIDGFVSGCCFNAARSADVNVTYHGSWDRDMLAKVRASPHGNTLCSVPVYDELSEADRLLVASTGVAVWCEIPPSVDRG